MRFAFIDAEKAAHSVSVLCGVLGVTRQGYYAHRRRRGSPRVVRDAELLEHIRRIFAEEQGRYGSPRILGQLKSEGIAASKRRVERLMRAAGLVARRRRRFVVTTRSDPSHSVAPNTLQRDFTASRPNEKWAADISYVWTAEGWVYLAVIIDLFSRRVVGWAVDGSMATDLPLRALDMALARRRPRDRLLHHSDRGCQYTSGDYRKVLGELGIDVSMSRRGNCWDNAVVESFFATLKRELVYERTWPNLHALREALIDYIELYYNARRLHSTLGYKSPANFEREYNLANAA